MRDAVKGLVELADIELAFARAEITMSLETGSERARILGHIDGARENLGRLLSMAGAIGQPGDLRRTPRRQTAWLRPARRRNRDA